MLDTLYPCKQRHKAAVTLVAVTVCLLSFPKWAHFHHEQQLRAVVATQYNNDRPHIMADIRTAIENRDLDGLRAIQRKYSTSVKDQQFHAVVGNGLAAISARQTEAQMAVSKIIDTNRHREEMGSRQLAEMPLEKIDSTQQQLSVLPK